MRIITRLIPFFVLLLVLSCKDSSEDTLHYPNGKLKAVIRKKAGHRNGISEFYYSNGEIAGRISYLNDIKSGAFIFFFKNGRVRESGTYLKGKYDGIIEEFDSLGNVISEKTYKLGKLNGFTIHYDNNKIQTSDYYRNDTLLKTVFFDKQEQIVRITRRPIIIVQSDTVSLGDSIGVKVCFYDDASLKIGRIYLGLLNYNPDTVKYLNMKCYLIPYCQIFKYPTSDYKPGEYYLALSGYYTSEIKNGEGIHGTKKVYILAKK